MNAKDLTNTEGTGTSEYVFFSVWMVMFLEAQGYYIKKDNIFQYNHSTIRMANNSRYSCTLKSSQNNICHLFVNDRVDKV